jgi:hypothetical protein
MRVQTSSLCVSSPALAVLSRMQRQAQLTCRLVSLSHGQLFMPPRLSVQSLDLVFLGLLPACRRRARNGEAQIRRPRTQEAAPDDDTASCAFRRLEISDMALGVFYDQSHNGFVPDVPAGRSDEVQA